jgi:NAD(P)-dependent dehydrogenase (short-subunit alcohol dehydrogenase family)
MNAPTANPFRLDGQVALVTGASRGIGAAILATLAAAGA